MGLPSVVPVRQNSGVQEFTIKNRNKHFCGSYNGDLDYVIDTAAASLGYKEERTERSRQSDCERKRCVCGTTHRIREVTVLPFVLDTLRGRPPSTPIVLCVSPLVSLMMPGSEGEVHSERSHHRICWSERGIGS